MYGEVRDLEKAWEIYYGVCNVISCHADGSLIRAIGFHQNQEATGDASDTGLAVRVAGVTEGETTATGSPRFVTFAPIARVVSLNFSVGTYQAGKPVVTIQAFIPKLTVIPSKQRPRRLAIKGSDGKDYHFVLKGT